MSPLYLLTICQAFNAADMAHICTALESAHSTRASRISARPPHPIASLSRPSRVKRAGWNDHRDACGVATHTSLVLLLSARRPCALTAREGDHPLERRARSTAVLVPSFSPPRPPVVDAMDRGCASLNQLQRLTCPHLPCVCPVVQHPACGIVVARPRRFGRGWHITKPYSQIADPSWMA